MISHSLKIGIWQDSGISGDISSNLQIIETAAHRAKARGVELLIFPECFLTGYFGKNKVVEIATSVDFAVQQKLARIACSTGVALLVGFYEIADDKIFITASCVCPKNGELARYRKRMLYGQWEASIFSRGSKPVMFEYRGIWIGILVCFDIEFPELARELANRGVELIVVPTSLMAPYEHVVHYLVPARAIENQIYVAYANRIGAEEYLTYVGRSMVCAPSGEILVSASAHETELIVCDIKRKYIDEVRREISYISELREYKACD